MDADEMDHVILEKISDSQDLMKQIRECLQFQDAKGLKTYILEHKLTDQTIFWELTSELAQHITEKTFESNPNFFEACERCLSYLVRCGNAKEMILALLEQADCFNDDLKYRTLLKLVQATLLKLPSKRFHSLDIALETLSAHVKTLELPGYTNLESKDKMLLDCDENVRRIGEVVSAYVEFFKPFVEEISGHRGSRNKKHGPQVLTVKKHLLFLLDHPLAHLDLEYNTKEGKAKSTSRRLAETIMDLLVQLECDFHKYLEKSRSTDHASDSKVYVEDDEEDDDADAVMQKQNEENERRLEQPPEPSTSTSEQDVVDNWKYVKSVPEMAQACLSYLLYVEHQGLERLPCIYDHSFLLEFNLPFISLFLKKQESLIITKGILLLQTFLDLIPKSSLSDDVLDNKMYMNVVSDMVGVMIYCPVKDLRVNCVQLLQSFIQIFQTSGRYRLFQMILESCQHAGVQGFTCKLIKDEVANNLHKDEPEKVFLGQSLDKLVKLLMKLPDGPATDLLENSDRVISVLNLLRFLILRDKPEANVTGIWTNFSSYDKIFLSPLRTGLDMSKAHYKLELDKLLSGKDFDLSSETEFSLMVGGQSLSAMPKEQRASVLQSALVTFDMTESVLVRLLELYDQQRSKHSKDLPDAKSLKRQSGSKKNIVCFQRDAIADLTCLKRFFILSNGSQRLHSNQGETTSNAAFNGESTHHEDKFEDEDHLLRERILESALPFVSRHGWSRKSLSAGAEAEDLHPVAHGMFPRGGAELVDFFYKRCNKQLAEALAAEVEELFSQGLEKPRTAPFIGKAVQKRLRMITPYIEQWPKAMAIQVLPQNAVESWKNLAHLMDDIWYYAGDRSTDFNWYTKRTTLAAVYKSTEVYMLQDKSKNYEDTWIFLDRRLNNLASFGKAMRNMDQGMSGLSGSLLGMCIVGRNVLGLNSRKR